MKSKILFFISIIFISTTYSHNKFEKNSKFAPCQKLYGKALVDCMDSLNDEKFLFQLYLLDEEDRQRYIYLEKKLENSKEYRDFFNRFKRTEAWQKFQGILNEEERTFFPDIHTKKDQQDYVNNLIFYENLKFAGKCTAIGVVSVAAISGGGAAFYLAYKSYYGGVIIAKAVEMTIAAKTTAGAITAKQAIGGGLTIAASAYANENNKRRES